MRPLKLASLRAWFQFDLILNRNPNYLISAASKRRASSRVRDHSAVPAKHLCRPIIVLPIDTFTAVIDFPGAFL
jgi:hypothetical protein